ncbi:Nucleic acid-binding, OB-fold [Phaffia rhodozyma]|uniref:Nucleic acid-binding, OB-fold n=1 Tax=Phaffia rhodozyma TaxID=264483 RepID=A0A0F7SJH5_PHARH|nr:Nucleic acid-binding, OB-fold [Phaffia rhodozyma]
MSILAPSTKHNITRVKRPPSAFPPSRMYYPPSMTSFYKPITTNLVHIPPDGLGSGVIEVVDDPYTIDQWLLRDESVARCSVDDAKALKQVALDIFLLNTFPCKYVELVGMIVSIDIKENSTIYTLDDGSSQNIDIRYVHNFATLARKAQDCPQPPIARTTRLSRTSTSSASTSLSSPARNGESDSKNVFKSYVPPKPLLPKTKVDSSAPGVNLVHVPKISIGDVTRVRVKVKKWMDNLQFFTQTDLFRTDLNEESLHAILVVNLRREVFPNFTQSTYLSSPFLPKRASAATSISTPKSNKANSKRTSACESPGSGRSDRSSSVEFSDISESSSVCALSNASSPLRRGTTYTPSKSDEPRSRQRDPSRIPSDQTTLDEFKLWIKEHMATLISIAWDQQTERDLDNGPVREWFSELRTLNSGSVSGWGYPRPLDQTNLVSRKGKERSHFNLSEQSLISIGNESSIDAYISSDLFSNSVSFASTSLSTSTYFHQIQSDLSSESPAGPPFSARSLTRVPHLLLYAQKIVKKTAKEWEKRRREDILREREEEKAAMGNESRRKRIKHEAWFSLVELESKQTKEGLTGWEHDEGDVVAMTTKAEDGREQETTRRRERERRKRKEESYTSKLKTPTWVAGKVLNLMEHVLAELVREGEIVSTDPARDSDGLSDFSGPIYLPLHLTTLGPVLLRLINTENASIRARSKKILPAGIKPPFGVDTQTIMRRLKSSEERWYFVSEIKVEYILDRMDKRDWIEYQRGGWRAL